MTLSFAKMSGAGNDFIVLDNSHGRLRRKAALARRLCHRHEGIGADGLLLLERSRKYDYRMRYYNADGTDGGMCGNGGRCIAWFAYVNGLAPRNHSFEALGREYRARIAGNELVSLSFPDPSLITSPWKTRVKPDGLRDISFIDTGSPHAVVRLGRGRLKKFPVTSVGRLLRNDASFRPSGTNVNFIEVQSRTRLSIRTYERGVEAETMACGTGSIACSIVGADLWNMKSPVKVMAPGGVLTVAFQKINGVYTDITLEGGARIVYEGTIDG